MRGDAKRQGQNRFKEDADSSRNELEVLRKAHDELQREMQKLERQIHQLERDRKQLHDDKSPDEPAPDNQPSPKK